MKAAVALLVVLGLVAAFCAAILFRSMTAPEAPPPQAEQVEPEVEVLVATRDLPAMYVVDGASVAPKRIKQSSLPEGALTSSVQVVGNVLTRPMVNGEPFTRWAFARDGIGVQLAAVLPKGKRAVSVSLNDYSSMSGLLYPGSVVDVLVSYQRRNDERMSRTLLQGVQVLAIGVETVARETTEEEAKNGPRRVNSRMITLLVDPKQAEILQLATQNGSVSLALRNPLDAEQLVRQPTRVSELYGEPLVRKPAFDAAKLMAMLRPLLKPPAPPKEAAPAPKWETVVSHGGRIEVLSFPMPAGQGSAADNGSDRPELVEREERSGDDSL